MQIAQVLSGYSLGGADLLRRAMGKKIKSEMEAQRRQFIDGAKARGVAASVAEHIFDQVAKFAGYGFNKSHAAAYALVAYQTAYLKANHPVEFMAALMSLDIGNTDKLNLFRQECDSPRHPPAAARHQPLGRCLHRRGDRAGRGDPLCARRREGRRRAGDAPARRGARRPTAAFADLFDFARRLDPRSFNRRQFESLVKAGAFDALNRNRAQTFAAIELLLRHATAAASERASQQVNLFGDGAAAPGPSPALPPRDGLAGGRAAAARIRRDRLLSLEPSARRLCAQPRAARRGALRRPAGAARRRRLDPLQARRRADRAARAQFGARQPLRLRPDVRHQRRLRGRWCSPRCWRKAGQLLDEGQPLLVTVDVRAEEEIAAAYRAALRAARQGGDAGRGRAQGRARRGRGARRPEACSSRARAAAAATSAWSCRWRPRARSRSRCPAASASAPRCCARCARCRA